MVYTDQTALFQSLLSSGSTSRPLSPEISRERSQSRSRSRTSSSRPGSAASRSRSRGGKEKEKGKGNEESEQGQEFLNEAYQIYKHLISLGSMLHSIRKPYLSTEQAPRLAPLRPTRASGDGQSDEDELRQWQGSKYLSERERDEIELRAKMILRRCRDRVSALEDLEKRRQAKVHSTTSTSTIFNLLPSLSPVFSTATDPSEPLIAAHRASIIWTLNNLLAQISASQMEMQEERAKRRAEKSNTLGARAAREAAVIQLESERRNGFLGVLGGSSDESGKGGSHNSSLGTDTNPPSSSLPSAIIPADEPSIESQLTPAQLQQFESENSHLLREMESQLTSVLSAEKSLLEISAMQTELVRHLVAQTEVTDRLYDEAIGTVGEIGKANEQLKKAKERGGEARMFLLIFLVGASMALLFLDWYA